MVSVRENAPARAVLDLYIAGYIYILYIIYIYMDMAKTATRVSLPCPPAVPVPVPLYVEMASVWSPRRAWARSRP